MTSQGRERESSPVPPIRAPVCGVNGRTLPTLPDRIRVGEHAVIRNCPNCRRHTLLARTLGVLIRADMENITTAGELAARITGRFTYDIRVVSWPPRIRLFPRGLGEIQAARKYAVVPDHRCNTPLETGPAPPYTGPPLITAAAQPDKPPF